MKRNTREIIEMKPADDFIKTDLRRTDDMAFCIRCARAVKSVSFWHAAEYLGTDVEEIVRYVEIRQLHRIHNQCGTTMICSASLIKLFQNRQTQKLSSNWNPYKTAEFQTEDKI